MNIPAIAARALPLLDLTSLNDSDTEATIDELARKAVTPAGHVAAVCIWQRFVAYANPILDQRLGLATVVNFPSGSEDRKTIESDIKAAIANGADEIDLVFPYQQFLAGKRTYARDIVAAARQSCAHGVLLKVILETGELQTTAAIREASEAAILSGADFLKTSTGKTPVGATLAAARTMLEVIHDMDPEVGFKASGGVRTAGDAGAYLALADEIMGEDWAKPETFRFGASGLLDDLLRTLGHQPAVPGTASGY